MKRISNSFDKLFLPAILIFSFLIAAYFLLSYKEVAWDAAQYLKPAEYWYNGNAAFKQLFWSPLLSFFEFSIFLVFGVNITAVSFFYAMFLPLLIYFVYKFVELFSEKNVAQFAALLVLFNQTIVFWSTRLYTDIPGAVLLVATLYFFYKADLNKDRKFFAISGLFFGLTLLMRVPNAAIASLAVFLSLLFNKKFDINYFKKFIFFSAALIPILIWFLYLFLETGNPLFGLQTYAGGIGGEINRLSSLHAFFSANGLVLLILFFMGLLKIKNFSDFRIISFFSALIIFLLISVADVRYAIPSIVFAITVAASSIDILDKKILAVLPLIVILILDGQNFIDSQNYWIGCSQNSSLVQAGDFLKNNYPEDSVGFANNFWAQLEFYSKRKTYAMVSEAPWLDEEMKRGKVKYIITDNKDVNIKYLENSNLDRKFSDSCRELYLWVR